MTVFVCGGGYVSVCACVWLLHVCVCVCTHGSACAFPSISLAVSPSFPESQYLFVSPQ